MKKNDRILIILLLTFAIIGAVGIEYFAKKDGNTVVVRVDGQIYKTLDLNKDTELQIESLGGQNILVIDKGQAYMKSADCRDEICVHQGKISKTGETIVCLPNKVVIEVVGKDADLDAIAK